MNSNILVVKQKQTYNICSEASVHLYVEEQSF